MHLLGGSGALQLLAVEQTLFDLLECLARLDKLLCAFPVPATVACGDQVCNAGGFRSECLGLDTFEELQCEVGHLLQADTEDGSLGVSSEAETIDHTSSESDDVLQCARKRDTVNVLDCVDTERLVVKDCVPESGVVGVWCADGGLAELAESDLEGNVCA